MFDPFGDYATRGYLRNTIGEKDPDLIKIAEHALFRAQLPEALDFLGARRVVSYSDFLRVHAILFGALYPWAGQDRAEILAERAVNKGDIFFCHPRDCQRAVEEGLSFAQARGQMVSRPGFIMGMFAYGNPFLDGNGRTMLLAHSDLCRRAGISIDWARTTKTAYLSSLSEEIRDPNSGCLDRYLAPFIAKAVARDRLESAISELDGLNGTGSTKDEALSYNEPDVAKGQRQFDADRGYHLGN